MKLLIITQKVNKDDPILGFFHRWLIEFAKHVELLTVICLEKGEHTLPENVQVLSLGKERGVGKIGQLARLYKYAWQYRRSYSHVFVHMNPIYVVLCWKLWYILRKPIFLWYTHKHVDWKLKIASLFVRAVFTASEESLRLHTKKKVVTGHGIDTDFFAPCVGVERQRNHVLTVGRISQSKNILSIIEAISVIPEAHLDIVGGTITAEDKVYEQACMLRADQLGCASRITWHGPVVHQQTRDFYCRTQVFVNLSKTGSLDKVLLEALACNVLVISSNDAAQSISPITYTSEAHLSTVLKEVLTQESCADGRTYVVEYHGLEKCVSTLLQVMSS